MQAMGSIAHPQPAAANATFQHWVMVGSKCTTSHKQILIEVAGKYVCSRSLLNTWFILVLQFHQPTNNHIRSPNGRLNCHASDDESDHGYHGLYGLLWFSCGVRKLAIQLAAQDHDWRQNILQHYPQAAMEGERERLLTSSIPTLQYKQNVAFTHVVIVF